ELPAPVQSVWDQQCGYLAVADDADARDPRIGGEQDTSLAPGSPDQVPVADGTLPPGVVAGGAQPTSQATQHGVAGETRLRRVGRHEMLLARSRYPHYLGPEGRAGFLF